jgi:hypothetical protein
VAAADDADLPGLVKRPVALSRLLLRELPPPLPPLPALADAEFLLDAALAGLGAGVMALFQSGLT